MINIKILDGIINNYDKIMKLKVIYILAYYHR